MKTSIRRLLVAIMSVMLIVAMSTTSFAYTSVDDNGDYSNQNETSMNVIYCNTGMLRIVDEGTSVTISEDGTKVVISANTSSSKNWGKVTKLAFIEQEASAADKDEAALNIAFEDSTYYANSSVSRTLHFSIPVQEIGKRIPVCRYVSSSDTEGEWKNFDNQSYYTVLYTNDLYGQLQEAYATVTDEATRANLKTAIDNADYELTNKCGKMFKPASAAVVKEGTNNILKLTMGSGSLDKVYMGFASEVNEDDALNIDITSGTNGYVDIPITEFDVPFVLAFHGTSWTNRTVVISQKDRTVTFLKTFEDAVLSDIPAQTFTGGAITPGITVTHKSGSTVTTLENGKDYDVQYVNNVNAGTANVTITGAGDFSGTKTTTFSINKANNPLAVSAKTVKLKKKTLKKKAKKLAAANVMTVSNAQGTVTYNGVGINKKSKKALKINASTGQVTVKKKTKKGTYKMKVTVGASGNGNYNPAAATTTITVKVK